MPSLWGSMSVLLLWSLYYAERREETASNQGNPVHVIHPGYKVALSIYKEVAGAVETIGGYGYQC